MIISVQYKIVLKNKQEVSQQNTTITLEISSKIFYSKNFLHGDVSISDLYWHPLVLGNLLICKKTKPNFYKLVLFLSI